MRLHAFVSGLVQGVFFRRNTVVVAKRLGLTGFVRNLVDGRVEVVAEGNKGVLEEFLVFLRKGPSGARVDNVEFNFLETEEGLKDFVSVYSDTAFWKN